MLYKLAIAPRQALRGCTNMPHVGEHPGTAFVVLMITLIALAGSQNGGLLGAILGGLMGTVSMGLVYAIGAASRANLSDTLVRRKQLQDALRMWCIATSQPTGKLIRLRFELDKGEFFPVLTGATATMPEYLHSEMERILTRPVGSGFMRHQPNEAELKTISVAIDPPTSHEMIEAINYLKRIKGSEI